MVKSDNTIFGRPLASEARMPLQLPCMLHYSDHNFRAATANISYAGVGVRLPADRPGFKTSGLLAVSVLDVGRFDVLVSWKRVDRLGLRFVSRKTARPILNAYFAKTGKYPF